MEFTEEQKAECRRRIQERLAQLRGERLFEENPSPEFWQLRGQIIRNVQDLLSGNYKGLTVRDILLTPPQTESIFEKKSRKETKEQNVIPFSRFREKMLASRG